MKEDDVELPDEEMDEEDDEEGDEEMTEENSDRVSRQAICAELKIIEQILLRDTPIQQKDYQRIVNFLEFAVQLRRGNENKPQWSSPSSPALLSPPSAVQSSPPASVLIADCLARLSSLAPSEELTALREELLDLQNTQALTPEQMQRLNEISAQLTAQEHKVSVSPGSR